MDRMSYDDFMNPKRNSQYKELVDWLDGLTISSRSSLFSKTKSQNAAFKKAAQIGNEFYNIRKQLDSVKRVVSDMGYSDVRVVPGGEKGVYTIYYCPPDMTGVSEADCPSVTIGVSDKYGVNITNHVPSMERMIAVTSDKGELGFASSTGVGLYDMVNQLDNLKRQARYQEAVVKNDAAKQRQLIKQTMSRAMRNATGSNAMMQGNRALQEHRQAFAIKDKRIESVLASAAAIDWTRYFDTLYNHKLSASAQKDRNVPKTAAEFNRQINNLFQDAKGVKNFATFEKVVAQKYPFIYKHLWNYLGNALSTSLAIGMTQGGLVEGTPNITSIGDIEVAGQQFIMKSSRKPKQNMNIQPPKIKPGEQNLDITYSKYQRKIGAKLGKLIYSGYAQDKDITNAYERLIKELSEEKLGKGKGITGKEAYNLKNKTIRQLFKENKFLGDFKRGLNLDASIYDNELIKDFQMEYERNVQIKKHDYDRELARVKEHMAKSGKTWSDQQMSEKAIRNLLNLNKGKKESIDFTKDVFNDFDINGTLTAIVRGQEKNPVLKLLAGGTADIRSVGSPMMSKFIGYILESAGYDPHDIWNTDGTLRMQFVQQLNPELKAKRFSNDAMGTYRYLVNEMRRAGKSNQDIASIINSKFGEKIVTPFSKGLEFNNKAKVSGMDFIRGITEIGQSQQSAYQPDPSKTRMIFDPSKEYFKKRVNDKGEEFYERQYLTPVAFELQGATTNDYSGVDSDSRLHWGYREYNSMRNTAGLMRSMGMSTTEFENELSARFKKANPEYNTYKKNIEDMKKYTFNPNVEGTKEAFINNGGILVDLNSDILKDFSDDLLEYGSNNKVVANEAYKNSPAYRIAQLQRERFAALAEEERRTGKKNIFTDASQIPVAIDLGKHGIFKNGDSSISSNFGNLVVLPSRVASEEDEEGYATYNAGIVTKTINALTSLQKEIPGNQAAARKVGKRITELQQEAADEVLNKAGAIYDKNTKIELKDSAYYMTEGMNSELINPNSNAYNKDYEGSVIGNIDDFLAKIEEANTEENAQDLQNQLLARYYVQTGGKNAFDKVSEKLRKSGNLVKQNRAIARILADTANVNSKNYYGPLSGIDVNRFPTIRGTNDIVSPGLLFDNSYKYKNGVATRGRVAVDPSLSIEISQDNDSDKIGISTGLSHRKGLSLDEYIKIEEEAKARTQFTRDLAAKQRILGLKDFNTSRDESPEGNQFIKIAEINDLQDEAVQLAQMQLVNSGKPLTGLYGDLADGVDSALVAAGLANSAIGSPDNIQAIQVGLQSQILSNFLAAAEQDAISAKKIEANTKGLTGKALTKQKVANIIEQFDMLRDFNSKLRGGASWNRAALGDLIDEGVRKGILDGKIDETTGEYVKGKENIFKSKFLADVVPTSRTGLNFLAQVKGLLSTEGKKEFINLRTLDKATGQYIDNKKEAKDVSDRELLEYMLKSGISKENFLDMMFGNKATGVFGLQNEIARNNYLQKLSANSLDGIVSGIYKFIPGKSTKMFYGGAGYDLDSSGRDILQAMGIKDVSSKDNTTRPKYDTLYDWGKSPEAQWDSMYKNIMSTINYEGTLKNFHTLQDYIFTDNPYGAKPKQWSLIEALEEKVAGKRNFNKFLKTGKNVNDYVRDNINPDDMQKTLESLGFSQDDLKDSLTVATAVSKGNIAHFIAEITANVMKRSVGQNWDEQKFRDEQQAALGASKELQYEKFKYASLLKAKGQNQDQIDIALNNAVARGNAQTSILHEIDPKNIIATEMALYGKHGKQQTSGEADLVYKDQDGNIVVYDYKNTKNGTLGGHDLVQTLHYAQDLQMLNEDIGAHQQDWHTVEDVMKNSELVAQFRRAQEITADKEQKKAEKYGGIFDREGYLATQEQNVRSAIDAFLNSGTEENPEHKASVYTQIGYANDGGTYSRFKMDLNNPIIRGILAKYNAGDNITKEDIDQAINNAIENPISNAAIPGFIGGANTESFKRYIDLLKQELDVENQLTILAEKKAQLEERGRANEAKAAENEIAHLQEQKTLREEEVKYAEAEVKKENKKLRKKGASQEGLEAVEHAQAEIISGVKTGKRAALELGLEEQQQGFISEDEKEYFKQYKQLMGTRSQQLARKSSLERLLGDKNSNATAVELKMAKRELKDVNDELKETESYLDKIYGFFDEGMGKATATGKDKFKALSKDLKKDAKEQLDLDKIGGDAKYQREKYMEGRKQYNEVYSVLSGLSTAQYRSWEIDQRLSGENNEKTRAYLLSEKQGLEELIKDAQVRVDALKAAYTDKNGKLDPRYQDLFDKAQGRVNNEQNVRMDAYLAKQKSGAGGGFLSKQLSMYFNRLLGGGLMMRAIGKIHQEIQKVIQQARELDKVLTNVRIVTNDTAESTRNLLSEYAELGKQIGATTKEVATSAIEWMRQGYEAAEANKLITASLYLSKLGMMDSTAATKSLTSALKGFKLEASEAMGIVDKLTAIDLKAATNAGDIAEGLAQFANLGSLSGVDIDQAAAYVATISDVTQKTGASSGQALKTIISRYGNVKAGAYNKLNVDSETSDATENLNDVEKVLNKIGISIRSTNLQFKDFDEVLAEIADKWESLDNVSKKAIANAFAGVRQQEAFVTLLENWDKYEQLLDTSRNSEGTAEMKYASYKESLEASTNKLQATIEDFVNKAEISNLLKTLTDIATSLAEGLPLLIKWVPQLILAFENLKIATGNSAIQRILNIEGVNNWWAGKKRFFNKNVQIAGGSDLELAKIAAEDGYDKLAKKYTRRAKAKGLARFAGMSLLGGETKADKQQEENSKKILATEQARAKVVENLQKKTVKFSLNEATRSKLKEKLAQSSFDTATKEALTKKLSSKEALTTTEKEQLLKLQGLTWNQKAAINEETKTLKTKEALQYETQKTEEAKEARDVEASGNQQGLGSSRGAAAASYIVNQMMSGISAYQTMGTSHKTGYKVKNENGEWVDEVATSSAEAHEVAATTAAVISAAIPLVGSFIAEPVANAITKYMDAGRDALKHNADEANEILNNLASTKDDFKKLSSTVEASTEADKKVRNQAIEDYTNNLYSENNYELRIKLEKYLSELTGKSVSILDLMENYKKGDEKQKKEIIRNIEIANKKLEIQQQTDIRAQQGAAYNDKINSKMTDYFATREDRGYTKNGLTKGREAQATAAGVGLGAVAGLGVGLGAGLLVSGPVGWIVGAVAGVTAAVYFGVKAVKAQQEAAQKEDQWNSMLVQDKIKTLRDDITELERQQVEIGNDNLEMSEQISSQIDKAVAALNALEDYQAWIVSEQRKQNKATTELGILEAKDDQGRYLTDLTAGQLKNMHIEDIYKALANQVDGKLINMTPLSNGELTEEFIDIASSVFKEYDVISSVLRGEAFTLSEAYERYRYKTDKNGNKVVNTDRFENEILQNFATALGTTVSGLSDLMSSFGNLKLSELLQSPTELVDTMNSYSELLSNIADGNQSVSEWMNKIVKQFPELTKYLGDMPSLMSAIMEKTQELNEYYIRSQWNEYATNDDYFTQKIVPDILKYYENDTERQGKVKDLIDSLEVSNMDSLMKHFNQFMGNIPEGSELDLYNAFLQAGSDTIIVADKYKESLKQYMDYQVSVLDKEIENLTNQRDMLQQINHEREYENKLIEARNNLENAQTEKRRIYRAGVGWVYEADQEKIQEAQDKLKEVKTEKDISAITKQINLLTATKDQWSNIWEEKNYKLQQLQADAFAAKYGVTDNANISTLQASLDKITVGWVDEEGQEHTSLLEGIQSDVATLTASYIEQNKKEVNDIINGAAMEEGQTTATTANKGLEQLWNEYIQALNNVKANNTPETVDAANNALSRFTKRYDDAVAQGLNMSDVTRKYATTSAGKTALDIGSSGADANKISTAKVFNLKDVKTDSANLYKQDWYNYDLTADFAEGLTDSDTLMYLWNDMKNSTSGVSKNRASFWLVNDDFSVGSEQLFYDHRNSNYDPSKYTDLADYASKVGKNMIVGGLYEDSEWALIWKGGLYKLGSTATLSRESDADANADTNILSALGKLIFGRNANGTLGTPTNGLSLINELGTEALVTPAGTVTALPAHTGVVPADITKNLWELGEVAPGILRALQMNILPGGLGGSANLGSSIDESLNINALTMNVNADNTFDPKKFVQTLREQAALSRNLK